MAAAIFLLAGCVSMNPSVVDPESYLGNHTNPPDVYRSAVAPGLLPVLDVRIDPMDRLFLVNFADALVYEGVELQTFPGEDGGAPGDGCFSGVRTGWTFMTFQAGRSTRTWIAAASRRC